MAAMKSTGTLSNISVENTLILIELFQSHECLWNLRQTSYRNLTMKKAAWTSIRLNFTERTGIECTDENVLKKLHALRNNFTRELRAVRGSKKSGAGTDDVRQSKWPYFSSMFFLRGMVNITTETTSNLAPTMSSSQETIQTQSQDVEGADTPMSQISSDDILIQEASQPAAETPSTMGPSVATPSRLFNKRKQTESPLQASLCQFIEEKRSKAEDPSSIWARNVGSTLNLIKSERRRILARMEVEQVLHKWLKEDLDD